VGVVGQTIAGLVSTGGAFLVITGLGLAIRRLRAWLGRRSTSTAADIAEPLAQEP
jgi:TRAP-type mannitol/chloroaromatic compound transport system permease small subunit